MNILAEIIEDLPEGSFTSFHVGEHWTAITANVNGTPSCGLASNPFGSTLSSDDQAELESHLKTGELKSICRFASRCDTHLASIGMAAINSLMPLRPESWQTKNASQVIADQGAGKRVALIGHFPFVPQLKQQVGHLDILELRPQAGDLDASLTPSVLPLADVVAITSMTFINGTFDSLLELCRPDAFVIVLGPSTPLSPRLFNRGVSVLCGSIVENISPVVDAIEKGMHFRDIHPRGVRLVTVIN